MRVGFVTHQFFPAYYTGVERLTLNLARQLQRTANTCTIITPAEHSGVSGDSYGVHGVFVRQLDAGRQDPARPWAQAESVRERLRTIIATEELDVLHVMHPMRFPQAFDAAQLEGVPTVAHVADFGYLCARMNLLRRDGTRCDGAADGLACIDACKISSGRDRIAWGRALLSQADAVISPCRRTTEIFSAEGFSTNEWHHIPWGVDYSIHPCRLPPPREDALTIGFIGTVLRHKGVHVVAEAMKLLRDENLRLLVYGTSFHESAYEDEVRSLVRGDPRIRFMGAYDHESFCDVLAPLDAVVVPSLWQENLPTTGLNAIAAGVPLIVSDVGGLCEIIEDYNAGWSFAVGDPASLASVLRPFVGNPATLREFRQHIEFPPSVEEEAWRIEMIYASLRRSKNRKRRAASGDAEAVVAQQA